MADANLTPSEDSLRGEDESAPSLTNEQAQDIPVLARSDYTEGEDTNIAIEPPTVEEEVAPLSLNFPLATLLRRNLLYLPI